jgi:cytochrome c biogenesis protein CcmG/thiol:disulfide interchange protein DsbE
MNLYSSTIRALAGALTLLVVNSASALDEGEVVPSFSLPNQTNQSVSLTQGSVTYIDFWASWCPPCRLALPFLNDLKAEFPGRVEVLAINTDASRRDADKMLATMSLQYPVLFDTDQKVISLFNPPKMPTSYLVGEDGRVLYVHKGFRIEDKDEIRRRVAAALNAREGDRK